MKSLNTKLVLSALAIAMLATPALAQRPDLQHSRQALYNSDRAPDAVARSGSVDPQYVPGFGNTGTLGFNEW